MSDDNRKEQPGVSPEFRALLDSIPKVNLLCSDPAHRQLSETADALADALEALVNDDMGLGEHHDRVVAALRLAGRLP